MNVNQNEVEDKLEFYIEQLRSHPTHKTLVKIEVPATFWVDVGFELVNTRQFGNTIIYRFEIIKYNVEARGIIEYIVHANGDIRHDNDLNIAIQPIVEEMVEQ